MIDEIEQITGPMLDDALVGAPHDRGDRASCSLGKLDHDLTTPTTRPAHHLLTPVST